jgi:hypothetical protein
VRAQGDAQCEQYLIRVEHDADHLDVAFNLADHPLRLAEPTHVLAADAETERRPAEVAPHGWAIDSCRIQFQHVSPAVMCRCDGRRA